VRLAIFLNSVNYFRGICILFIVAGHCVSPSGWHIDSFFEKVFINLVYGGSALFVFISGFLFHHVFYNNFDYLTFVTKKVKNVLIPYLILSSAPIIYFVIYKGTASGRYSDYIFLQKEGVYYEYARPIIMYLWSGCTLTAYWYIPFIMIVFLLSPFFIAYIHLKPATRLFVLCIMIVIASLIHRPVDNLYPLQSVVYFAPLYAYGILASIHKDAIYDYLKGKEIYLLILIVLCASLQVILYNHFGNFHKSPFAISYPDIIIFQKMIMCLFFMVFLHKFEDKNFAVLKPLASASFAIYFLHPFVISAVYLVISNLKESQQETAGILWLMIFPVVVILCIVIAKIIKAIFRSYSRQVIGW
jgi:surface polysaccharide O-acyltransferase-like enzyme